MTQFIDLPAEIRNMIYDYVLLKDGDQSPGRRTNELALFTVSKEFHREASSYFYGSNEFTVDASAPSTKTANVLPPIADQYVRSIRRLTLEVWVGDATCSRTHKVAQSMLSLANARLNLAEVTIRIQSPLSHLLNSRVDDSVMDATHPITVALRDLLTSSSIALFHINLESAWFSPGIAAGLHSTFGSRIELLSNGATTTDPAALERPFLGQYASTHLSSLGLYVQDFRAAAAKSIPSLVPPSLRSAFSELDTFSTYSYATTCSRVNIEIPRSGQDEPTCNNFNIEQWSDAACQADESELGLYGMDLDIDIGLEPFLYGEFDLIMLNIADTAKHVAHEEEIDYFTNFAPELF